MARPKKPPEKKLKVVSAAVDPTLRAKIQAMAKATELPISEVLRKIISIGMSDRTLPRKLRVLKESVATAETILK